MVNTVFVLRFIYFLLGDAYAAAQGISYQALFSMLLGVVFMNGIGEAVVSVVLTGGIGSAVYKNFPDISELKNLIVLS